MRKKYRDQITNLETQVGDLWEETHDLRELRNQSEITQLELIDKVAVLKGNWLTELHDRLTKNGAEKRLIHYQYDSRTGGPIIEHSAIAIYHKKSFDRDGVMCLVSRGLSSDVEFVSWDMWNKAQPWPKDEDVT